MKKNLYDQFWSWNLNVIYVVTTEFNANYLPLKDIFFNNIFSFVNYIIEKRSG
jgi:hypothetical protein